MSNETKWTPGPWAVGISSGNGIPCVDAIDTKDGKLFEVCEVWGEERDTEETHMSRANAHLIAAAPEMYGAIEWALAVFSPDTPEHAAILEAMHAALAKASGEKTYTNEG